MFPLDQSPAASAETVRPLSLIFADSCLRTTTECHQKWQRRYAAAVVHTNTHTDATAAPSSQ